MPEARKVDPWRFAGSFLRRIRESRLPAEPEHPPIPWTSVTKPRAASPVVLLSTAGLSMRGDTPFDMDGERKRPTCGDLSWRRLRADATSASIEEHHLHIDTGYTERGLNVALPLGRLRELVPAGEVGAAAPTHYSIMGSRGGDTTALETRSAPEIAAAMRSEEVDLALLAPV